MAKSKGRRTLVAVRSDKRESWKSMTPEARKAWSEHHRKTAKTGYAKRSRERDNGAPMTARTGEGIGRRFMAPHSRPCAEFGPWLRQFWAMTAA